VEFDADDLGTGAVAPVDEDIDFGDISFDSEVHPLPVEDSPSGAMLVDDGPASDSYEFDLEEVSDVELAPEHRTGVTMEVSVDQVEEMVSLESDSSGELEFDDALVADEDVDDFDFADAQAFDAELPYDPHSRDTAEAGYPAQGHGYDETPSPTFEQPAPYSQTTPDYTHDAGHQAPVQFDDAQTFDPDADLQFDTVDGPQPPAPHAFDAEPLSDVSSIGADFDQPITEIPSGDVMDYPETDQVAGGIDTMEADFADPVAEPPTAEPAGTALEDDLDEADFFVSQGLYGEARDILHSLLARYPNHPLVTAKLRDVDAMAAAADGGGNTEFETPAPELDAAPMEPEVLEEMSGSHKPSVMLEKPVEDEDADTHYDLGLAYKEMGLYSEAIQAFNKVINNRSRAVQCHLMIGLCHREQGNFSEAVHQFKAGLHTENINDREKYSLYYEIAASYEAMNDPGEAVYFFEMVAKKDPEYRDVSARLARLRSGSNGESDTRRTNAAPDDADAALDNLLAEPDLSGHRLK
jgi:hypothetical protein